LKNSKIIPRYYRLQKNTQQALHHDIKSKWACNFLPAFNSKMEFVIMSLH